MSFAMLGAELPEQDVHSNYQRTSNLRIELTKLGLSFVGVQNVFQGRKSQMFLVTNSDEMTLLKLAKGFDQKAILVSANGNMEVVSTRSNGRTALGKLVPVSKLDAEKKKFHIFFQEDGKDHYYATNINAQKGANYEISSSNKSRNNTSRPC